MTSNGSLAYQAGGLGLQVLPSARVNEALDRLRSKEVRYRFVLDMPDLG